MKYEQDIPAPKQRRGPLPMYGFDDMQPGQSCFLPVPKFETQRRFAHKVGQAARHYFGAGNYITRATEDPERGLGVRVWRTG